MIADKKYVLALDAGTTAMKCAIFDLSGALKSVSSCEYTLENPSPDFVELDPEIYWKSAKIAIAEVLSKSAVKKESVASIGVTSQGETLIILDHNGRPLRKAIVWLDNRGKEETEEIRRKFGRERIYRLTGQQDAAPCLPASKILWVRKHEPELFKRAAKFLMLEDYLIYRLSGEFATDHAMSPSTLYYDLPNGKWWKEMLDFIGISETHLPRLLNSGEAAGKLNSHELGLSDKTIVAVAPIDQVAAAVGAGNIAPGMLTETTGCALAVCATVRNIAYDPKMLVSVYRHVHPNSFILMPWIPTAGMIFRWFRDEFGGGADYASLSKEAESVMAGCDGLIMLPHLCGMNSPVLNPDAKGVFFGISPGHKRAHFVRAILESVAFSLRDNIELLDSIGVNCNEIVSLGGGARSKFWLQIKADLLQKPIKTMKCEETTSLGTAMLSALGAGIFKNLAEAVESMVHPASTVIPDPSKAEIYDNAFSKYTGLNKKLFE
ncbi:MAG TPA: FGGY family carbohydrate kinase [Victivallales bacterium]|nr:FGGY family carbohydrate kinase [Victivallales bacterium]